MTTDCPSPLEAIVNQTLAVLEQRGVRHATAYRAAHGAGFALKYLVMAEPARRPRRIASSNKRIQQYARL
jgi:hypothetical protein